MDAVLFSLWRWADFRITYPHAHRTHPIPLIPPLQSALKVTAGFLTTVSSVGQVLLAHLWAALSLLSAAWSP